MSTPSNAPVRGLSGATKGMRFMVRNAPSAPTPPKQQAATSTNSSSRKYGQATPLDCYGAPSLTPATRRSFGGFNHAVEVAVKECWRDMKFEKKSKRGGVSDEEMVARYKKFVDEGGDVNRKKRRTK